MSVTITATPNSLNASRRYIRYWIGSDRYDSTAVTGVTLADNGSSFCRYSKAGIGANYKVGDVLTPTLYSNPTMVRQTITVIDGANAWVDTDLTFVAATMTDLSGTVTRTNDNFKVRARVYVAGTLVATLYKQAVAARFEFYIERIVDAYLSYTLPTQGAVNIVTPQANHIKEFYVIFDEYYDNAAGLSTLCTDAAVTSSTYNSVKASRKDTEAVISSTYDLASTVSKFLTNSPNNYVQEIFDKEEVGLNFFCTAHANVKLGWKVYDAAFNVLGSGLTAAVALSGKYGYLPVNQFAIATDKYIDVWVEDNAGNKISEYFKFKISTKKFAKTVRVMWLNRLGGWDWFDFNYDYQLIQDEEKFEIKRKLNYGYTASSRAKETVYCDPIQSFLIRSKYVTKAVAEWLFELKSSKQVYMNNVANQYYPLNNIEMDIPLIEDDTHLIQVEFKAEIGQIE